MQSLPYCFSLAGVSLCFRGDEQVYLSGLQRPLLLLDHSAAPKPNLSPASIEWAGCKWRLGSFPLVDLDAPSRLLIHPKIAVFHLRAALENRLGPVAK